MTPNFFFFFNLFTFLSCSASKCSGVRAGQLGSHWQRKSSSEATGPCVDPMGWPVARLVPPLLFLLPWPCGEFPLLVLLGGVCAEGQGPGSQGWLCVSVPFFLCYMGDR